MIKFEKAIQKETGAIITYEMWLKAYGELGIGGKMRFPYIKSDVLKDFIPFVTRTHNMSEFIVKDIIFSDDYEIIY